MKKTAALLSFLVLFSFAALLIGQVHSTTWTYDVDGPYWEDGTVANANVSLVWTYVDGEIERTWLNATGGVADSDEITASAPVSQLMWLEAGANDTQRYIDLDPTVTDHSYSIVIPSQLFATAFYYIQVSDFAGITNAWLQSKRNVDGSAAFVEQRSLNFTGDHILLLSQWASYTLSITCDQGTYSETYMAGDPSIVHSIILPSGLFLEDFEAGAEVQADRYNSTEIIVQQSYDDEADSSYVHIWHLDEYSTSASQITDYVISYGSGDFILYWNDGEEGRDYFVDVEVDVGSVTYVWNFSCPDGRDYDSIDDLVYAVTAFGDFGVDPAALIAFVICLICAGCFSYANSAMGAGFVLIVAAILSLLGLYEFAAAQLGLGAVFVWFFYVLENKKTEREY